MGHTLVHASRSAQLGQLAERPSPARIAAYSSVIALHAAAFVLLMMPMAAPAPNDPGVEVVTPIFLPPHKKDPELVPVTPPPPTHPVRVTTHNVAPPTPVPPVLVDDSPMSQPYVETPPTEDVIQVPPAIDTTPISDAQLVYASAPPPSYPKDEEHRRIEGTVLLRVLVGVDGKPIDVTVERSSGNRRLDDAARKQVLRAWSFKPASRNGVAVQAIGLVPISFTMR